MVSLTTTLLASLATLALAESAVRSESFSFEKWTEEIIADPSGDHLSPEDAFKLAMASEHQAVPHAKRDVSCDQKPSASVSDAVQCINQLAAKGTQECHASYGGATVFCTYGKAQVVAVTNKVEGTSSSCQDVARGLGAIMDQCWRPDNTVQGQSTAWGNGDMAIHLSEPLI
ncbi:uncharacterized protein F5Z01DRAFT_678021 [Emericellopsis atlantica]|uniref:Uncharacterized protein n=1 Tax=Emericellopsis atlantica TaxID=2614577 RepID=A0A9P7ZDN7_9HYPO|nr:uncharacterized protein F5Z01DRAFT_678021 [Emericellopsis atlantica]KAG9250223.1 hypothetical protein F5Z01DRAFT_678021 [Emericellopsis atlantica]